MVSWTTTRLVPTTFAIAFGGSVFKDLILRYAGSRFTEPASIAQQRLAGRTQGAAVPDLVEISINVGFLDEDDVAVVLPIVGLAVGRDEAVDEFLDGGKCGVIGREFGEVFG